MSIGSISRRNDPGSTTDNIQRASFSFDEFCARNGISRRTLYNLLAQGLGPRTMKLAGRRLVSAEAERDWIREREEAAASAA